MQCPKCNRNSFKVTGSVTGLVTIRFRKCNDCGYTFKTIECIKHDDYSKYYAKVMIAMKEVKA